eukprot:4390186-Amphidinium_carterae.1
MRFTGGAVLVVSSHIVLPRGADFASSHFGIVVLTTASAEDVHGASYASRVHSARSTWAREQPVLFIAGDENAQLGIEAPISRWATSSLFARRWLRSFKCHTAFCSLT